MVNKDGKIVSPTSEAFQAAAANADWNSVPGYGVILANTTFYAFDHESAGARRPGLQPYPEDAQWSTEAGFTPESRHHCWSAGRYSDGEHGSYSMRKKSPTLVCPR